MYSNRNILTISKSNKDKYKEGDKYLAPIDANWRIKRFNGLYIQRIDFTSGMRLHFDHEQWFNNKKCTTIDHNMKEYSEFVKKQY